MNLTHELESARAHWSQVYTKTKQIGRSLRSSRTKAVSISEMQELREPCARAKEPTLETFWCYLEGHRAEEKISLGDEPVPGVKITSVWLWVYFGHTLLSEQSQVLPSYLQDHHFTPQEQLEFYQRLSAYCLYALDEIRQEQQSPSLEDRDPFRPEVVGDVSPVEFVRSLIYLIAEYAHTDVALPRAFDLEKHLRDALSSDALLYSMAELYRDHVLHVVDVCLLGYFLLNCKVRGDQSLLALVSQGRCSREALLRNWFLASLFHDIGYGLEIYYRITDQLAFLEAPRLAKAKVRIDDCIDGALLRFCRKANKALAREEILSSPVGEVLDHGIVSYLHVKELLEAVPDGASAMDELESGLRAIAKHNLMREAISFEDEPVAFLLVLCDELQDWGRPRIESAELREAIVSKIIFSDRSTLKANRLLKPVRECRACETTCSHVRWDNRLLPTVSRCSQTRIRTFVYLVVEVVQSPEDDGCRGTGSDHRCYAQSSFERTASL